MHVLAVNSVTSLLNYLKEQLANTPTETQIKALNETVPEPEANDEELDGDEDLAKAKVWRMVYTLFKFDSFS